MKQASQNRSKRSTKAQAAKPSGPAAQERHRSGQSSNGKRVERHPPMSQGASPRPFVLKDENSVPGYDPWTLRVREELGSLDGKPLRTLSLEGATVEVRPSDTSMWFVGRWNGNGRVAVRPAYVPGGGLKVVEMKGNGSDLSLIVDTPIGAFRVRTAVPEAGLPMLRVTTTFTPRYDTCFPYWPRDLYPIDAHGDPLGTRGVVHAAQRDSAAGLVYLTITRPEQATLLYFQNLTWLNGYAQTVEADLSGAVGGEWPHLGYQPPGSTQRAMTAGEEEEWSDFFVCFCQETPTDEGHRARVFLDALSDVYRHLPPPATVYRDWPARAEETLEALESPKCWTREMGYDYLRPYVDAENPDSMVQAVLIPRLMRYGQWSGRDLPLVKRLRAGLRLFYDEGTQAVRRYLPSVPDHDPNTIDSWYLYHPLIDLARLAHTGDEEARDLLAQGIGFAIKAARHFDYRWPVSFNLLTLDPKVESRKKGELGETDVPGLYAYLMLQARDILGVSWYVEEARRALDRLEGHGFSIGYQFNNVAWGAVACARMWQETRNEYYLGMSYSYLASFFHNTILWEPDFGLTRAYSMFMAVRCLHDAEYSAMFEEYEAFTAFHEYLGTCADEVPPAVRLLVAEYCRFTLSRAWYYYPSELPEEAVAKEPRNGHIDRDLALPLEDLYAVRCPAGTVGQEVYGAGAPFEFIEHAYRRLPDSGLVLFAEYPVHDLQAQGDQVASFRLLGDARMRSRLRVMPSDGGPLPQLSLCSETDGTPVPLTITQDGHAECHVPGDARLRLAWKRQ